MFPLRKSYMRRLMREAGFEAVRTYGDFHETYEENEPDFFIHIAEKSAIEEPGPAVGAEQAANRAPGETEAYYDSSDADTFYSMIWGGEDIHVGCYEHTRDISEAGAATADRMAGRLATTHNLRTHYDRVHEELQARRAELVQKASPEYLDNMLVGLKNWVDAADSGDLVWGIQHFRKPD